MRGTGTLDAAIHAGNIFALLVDTDLDPGAVSSLKQYFFRNYIGTRRGQRFKVARCPPEMWNNRIAMEFSRYRSNNVLEASNKQLNSLLSLKGDGYPTVSRELWITSMLCF